MLKLIVVGNSGAGKTTAIHRFLHGKSADTAPTLGVEMNVYKPGNSAPVYIWDMGGDFNIFSCLKEYMAGSHGAVVVYDVNQTDAQQFNAVAPYVDIIRGLAFKPNSLPIFVLGNQCDRLSAIPTKPAHALHDYLAKRGIRHEFTGPDEVDACRDAFNSLICCARKYNVSPLCASVHRRAQVRVREDSESPTTNCSRCTV